MDWFMMFLKENWMLIVLMFVVVVALIKMVKTVIKWVITLIIVIGLVFYGSTYIPEGVLDATKQVQEKLTDSVAKEYISSILRATEIKVSKDDNNGFVLNAKVLNEGKVFSLKGNFSTGKATLYVGKQEINVNLDSTTLKFIKSKL